MRVWTWFLIGLLITMTIAPAQSQNNAGTVWFTNEVVDSAEGPDCGIIPTYGSTIVPPTDAEPKKAYTSIRAFNAGCPGPYFRYVPDTAITVKGIVHVEAYLSCDAVLVSSPAGTPAEFRNYVIELSSGGTVLGDSGFQFSEEGVAACAAGEVVYDVIGDIDVGSVTIKAGGDLTVEIALFVAPTGQMDTGQNAHFLVYGTDHASYLSATGIPQPPSADEEGGEAPDEQETAQTFYEDLSGDSVAIDHTFTEETSDSYRFNWTTDLTSVNITYDAVVKNGTASFVVVDGDDATLLEGILSANFTLTESFENVTAGGWSIQIDYDSFEGSFNLGIAETSDLASEETEGNAEETSTSTGTQTSSETSTSATQTKADAAEGGSNGIPGFGIVTLVASVGAVLALMRRRL